MRRLSASFEHLAAAAQLDPGNPDAQFNLGVFFLQNQHWPDATRCFAATLRLQPEFVPAHIHLAETLVKQGKFNEAAAQYRDALRMDPNSANAKNGFATLLAAHPELK